MNQYLKKPFWSPYVVGTGIGVLAWITFYFMNEEFGTTISFIRLAGILESAIFSHLRPISSFFTQTLGKQPLVEWYFAFFLCIFVGAWISAKLSGTTTDFIPTLWAQNFGVSKIIRICGAFSGGALAILGAALAGGCTASHAISGGLKLATLSWIFLPSLFAGGILFGLLLYTKR